MKKHPEILEELQNALADRSQPAYLLIAEFIEEKIREGLLKRDDQLPTLRDMAAALHLDYTTVARAYHELQHRGLIASKSGVGSYIKVENTADAVPSSDLIEMTMNVAPEPQEPEILGRMRHGIRHVTEQGNFHRLTRYQELGGNEDARAAAATWLEGLYPAQTGQTALITPGIQATLNSLMLALVGVGGTLCAEGTTYPGVKTMARHFGIKTIGLRSDHEGILPDDLEAQCRIHTVKALYLNPTIQNPTTRTISENRRFEIAAVARQFGLKIIEDDPYNKLMKSPPPTFANIVPELTYYVSGLSKTVGAGLRIGFLVCPNANETNRLASTLRASEIMASPLCIAVATQWILDGTAQLCLQSIQTMSQKRQLLAKRTLGDFNIETNPEGFHLWLNLPSYWTHSAFCSRLLSRGITTASAEMFCLQGTTPNSVRLCLGGNLNEDRVEHALQIIAETVSHMPRKSEQA